MPPTAELEAPKTEVEKQEPVTAPGQTSLSSAWKAALEKEQAAIAKPDPNTKVEAKTEPEPKKEEVAKPDDKAEVKKEESKKPVSALDAALEPAAKVEEQKTEEVPANAPAKQLREAMERHKADANKWKAEAEKASKGDPAVSQKLAALQEERDKLAKQNTELREAITVVNVDLDPDVRAKYHDGKSVLVKSTTASVEQLGGDGKAFEEALAMPASKARTQAIRASLEEVDELDRTTIYNKLAKITELEEEHADLLKNSQKSYAELTKKQQERFAQQQEEVERSKADIFNKATKALPNAHPTIREVPDTVEGHEEWNARLKADHSAGLRLLGSEATMEEISAAAVKGARYDFVESLLLEERKTSAELRDRIAKYESAEPGFDGRLKASKLSNNDKTPAQVYREKLAELSSSAV